MDTYKKWHVGLSIATAAIAAGVWFYWQYICEGSSCNIYFIRGAIKPILFGNLALAIILFSLLPFPSRLFKQWLVHIASWSILFSIYFILGEDPRSSGVLAFGRGLLSWVFGTLIFILTILYAFGWHIYEWRKGRVAPRDFARLSVFLISGAFFYSLWQLF